MFKVVCISDKMQYESDLPAVKKGNIYTVVSVHNHGGSIRKGYRYIKGTYYILAETGNKVGFYHDMFIRLNEDQKDETEFSRNYEKEKV